MRNQSRAKRLIDRRLPAIDKIKHRTNSTRLLHDKFCDGSKQTSFFLLLRATPNNSLPAAESLKKNTCTR